MKKKNLLSETERTDHRQPAPESIRYMRTNQLLCYYSLTFLRARVCVFARTGDFSACDPKQTD